SDQTSGHDRAPPARRDIEEEKREGQELEADGQGQEQSRRKRTVAEAPRGEREAEREEVHVAERHLEYEAEKEDIARSGPRPPEQRRRRPPTRRAAARSCLGRLRRRVPAPAELHVGPLTLPQARERRVARTYLLRWRTKNSSASRMISRERSSSSRVSKPCCPVG